MRRVITYGTFDLLHYGHINLLRRAKEQGDYLIVALSTDEFNWNEKRKKSYFSYEDRKRMLEAIRYVDLVIPEESWESVLNDDVELTVLHLGERTLEQAQDWVRAEEDDYQLVEDKQGGLGGTDTEELEMLEVRFHPSGSGMYAVLYKCPMEAIEGFGTRLSVMADTFQVME